MLAKALEVWNLTLQPLDAPEMQSTAQHPEQENAFICNLQASAQPLLHICLTASAILALANGALQLCILVVCSVTISAQTHRFLTSERTVHWQLGAQTCNL